MIKKRSGLQGKKVAGPKPGLKRPLIRADRFLIKVFQPWEYLVMKLSKRLARAKRRAKTMQLRRMGVPCTASKFGYGSEWVPPVSWLGTRMTFSAWQSYHKQARRAYGGGTADTKRISRHSAA